MVCPHQISKSVLQFKFVKSLGKSTTDCHHSLGRTSIVYGQCPTSVSTLRADCHCMSSETGQIINVLSTQ